MKVKSNNKYGIKAHGKWKMFDSCSAYREYLFAWIAGTDGAECDRAVTALVNLDAGIAMTDTDAI